jgi:hypothetical protein
MASESRRLAGILLIVFPSAVFGGVSLLTLIINVPGYMENPLRQDLWRAGHAHAAVLLILSLVALRYVDETGLTSGWRWVARLAVPVAALLMPIAFFLSVLTPDATEPNAFIYLAYVGAVSLIVGMVTLGACPTIDATVVSSVL